MAGQDSAAGLDTGGPLPIPRARKGPGALLVLLAIAALAIAACSSGDGSVAATPVVATPELQSIPTAASDPGISLIAIGNAELGPFITDSEGRAVYAFLKDEPGASNCTGRCLGLWHPVPGPVSDGSTDGLDVEIGEFERPDGLVQATVSGHPIYYFEHDYDPGFANGHGANDQWWVLMPDGDPLFPPQLLGR